MDNSQIYLKNCSNATNSELQIATNYNKIDTIITSKLLNNMNENQKYIINTFTLNNINNDNINNSHNCDLWKLPSFIYVLSSFAVKESVYYYEVEILQNMCNKKIFIGWVTKFVEIYNLNSKSCLRNDAQSFLFQETNLLPGDIIGCFVNVEQQQMNVYYNGKLILVNTNKNIFKNLPIFAVTIIQTGQKVQVNFGNKKFKHPPFFNEHYKTFHSMTIKKSPSFELKIKDNIDWCCKQNISFEIKKVLKVFEYEQNNLENPLRFSDSVQKQFDKKIVEIELMINNGNNLKKFLSDFIVSMFQDSDDEDISQCYRVLQSVVETIGHKIEINKLNMLNECIFFILKNTINKNTKILNFRYLFHSFIVNYILKYFKTNDFQIINIENNTKIHYICLILYYFIENICCCEYLKKQCELSFHHVLQHSRNPWCQLYSFKGLIKNDETKNKTKLKQFLLMENSKKEKPPFFIWRNIFKARVLQIFLFYMFLKVSL